MNKTNVLMMWEFRELQELKRSGEVYGRYLNTLGNSQLETEINFLLEEFSQDSYGKDFFKKGNLILKEIASRADGDWKVKIESLAFDRNPLI